VSANQYVLATGMRATRATVDRWQRDPWPVLRGWAALAFAIALVLLGATWIFAGIFTPDGTPIQLPGRTVPARADDMLPILYRNSLVLALHATACVAGFIAGSSMPVAAAQRRGFSRWIHIKASQLAIVWVSACTVFSLLTQAVFLGFQGATISYQLDISHAALMLSVLPHAIPELVALFLPLAAWLIASRRGEWDQLLAATFVTVLIAIPMLVASAAIEVYIWPHILDALSPLQPDQLMLPGLS
jgi:hypothetical protein